MAVLQQIQLQSPRAKRWTVKEYHKLGTAGLLRERTELIEGVIYEMMTINPPHTMSIQLAARALQQAYGTAYHVRMQQPLHLGPRSEPIPDLAVVPGDVRDYVVHPTTAELVVEISDTTLWYDRRRKGSLFAKAGIADYWIVNLNKMRLEVYRTPVVDHAARYGHSYANVTFLTAADAVGPLSAPASRIAVADLLP